MIYASLGILRTYLSYHAEPLRHLTRDGLFSPLAHLFNVYQIFVLTLSRLNFESDNISELIVAKYGSFRIIILHLVSTATSIREHLAVIIIQRNLGVNRRKRTFITYHLSRIPLSKLILSPDLFELFLAEDHFQSFWVLVLIV